VKIWLTGGLAGGLVALGWLVLVRSRAGLRLENQLRAWSDRAMLAFLQMTSEFEAERRAG
jgi:hypothetical protein